MIIYQWATIHLNNRIITSMSDENKFGPLNQCEHPNMKKCCGHWICEDCGLSFDEFFEGDIWHWPKPGASDE